MHNILRLKNKGENFLKLVAEFDYYMTSNGKAGIPPNTLTHIMSRYLGYSAYTKSAKFGKAMSGSDVGIMLFSYHIGMHYVALRKTNLKSMKYYVYNWWDASKQGTYHKSISSILDLPKGKQGNFCMVYIVD